METMGLQVNWKIVGRWSCAVSNWSLRAEETEAALTILFIVVLCESFALYSVKNENRAFVRRLCDWLMLQLGMVVDEKRAEARAHPGIGGPERVFCTTVGDRRTRISRKINDVISFENLHTNKN